MDIRTKRVYDPAEPDDGTRVLVDRLWPRGLKKEQVAADLWLKEVAPSTELRKWFHSESPAWGQFKARYLAELEASPGPVEKLLEMASSGRLTLLYSVRDPEQNHAVLLRDYLHQQM